MANIDLICGRCEDVIEPDTDYILVNTIHYCDGCSHFVTYDSEEEEEEEEDLSHLPENWATFTLDQRIAWTFKKETIEDLWK